MKSSDWSMELINNVMKSINGILKPKKGKKNGGCKDDVISNHKLARGSRK